MSNTADNDLKNRPSNVFSHRFVDEAWLFSALGVSTSNAAEAVSTYEALRPKDRPSLSPFFSVSWYLECHRDLIIAGVDAFNHFCELGVRERRSPHPLISFPYMLARFPSFFPGEDDQNELLDYIKLNKGNPSAYFDINYYLEHTAAARDYPGGALRHYLEAPANSIGNPNAFFEATFYSARYTDAPADPRNAFLHFVSVGDGQCRLPGPGFDSEWYVRNNPDVGNACVPPLWHFLDQGSSEGRPIRQWGGGRATKIQPSMVTADFSPDLKDGRIRYAALRSKLDLKKDASLNAVPEHDARPITGNIILEDLKFSTRKNPKISIIIAVFNEFNITLQCLRSIMDSRTKATFEIILVNDASTDERVATIKKIPGIVYIENRRNLNFLRSCNRAYELARGEYVFLLNNDAQICEGCIDILLSAIIDDETVGAVGPKILFPNGRLQEAGCAVNKDATSTMIGLRHSPGELTFSYKRNVHYISGAALFVRRSAIGSSLFDERYIPAYCEDLDLCLSITSNGLSIYYVPDAVVVHHLSISMSDKSKKIRNIRRNQQKVVEKWASHLQKMNQFRIISFYLPQYHPVAENNLWWGDGFTEWTNVTKALPSYEGHYQPHLPSDLGFYDLRLVEVYQKQASLISRYGLGGVCLYYYNFGGSALLNTPLETILANRDIELPFCLCWANENWSRRWDGGTKELLCEQSYDDKTIIALTADLVRAAKDRRYIKVDDEAVFLIYRPLMVPNVRDKIQLMKEIAQADNVRIKFIYVESLDKLDEGITPIDLGFSASVEFPPHGIAVPMADQALVVKEGWNGARYNYPETVVAAMHRPTVPWPRYPSAFPSWDNTARQPLKGVSFDESSPEAFQLYVEEKISEGKSMFVGESRIMFVNAWNEWAEGAHLEPDRAYGHRWLEALHYALLKQGCL